MRKRSTRITPPESTPGPADSLLPGGLPKRCALEKQRLQKRVKK